MGNKGNVLITGGQGFVGSYLCQELLKNEYEVWSIDDFSKYGPIKRPQDTHKNFHLIEADIKKLTSNGTILDKENKFHSLPKFDYVIALAAHIGGISYFSKFSYDLFTENEGIMKATFDYLIKNKPKRVMLISSSMVYENTLTYPSCEEDVNIISPPFSSYGRQKLVCEWWAKAAQEQYGIPFTIIRPFNCVGVGEDKTLAESDVLSGNIKLQLSHVLPDIINKCLQGQDPLHILGDGNQIRCFTNGKDIAQGIRLAMESEKAINNEYNISTPVPTTIFELSKMVWERINPGKPFSINNDKPFLYDVQKRIPDVSRAKNDFDFEAKISFGESIDEVISYMKDGINTHDVRS